MTSSNWGQKLDQIENGIHIYIERVLNWVDFEIFLKSLNRAWVFPGILDVDLKACGRGKCGMGTHIGSGRYVCSHNNLCVLFPELAKEWGINDNGPECYSYGSHFMANWDCKNPEVKCGCHKWPARIDKRTRKNNPTGCPFCAGVQICIHDNLAVRFPELAKEWGVNDKGPECYSHGSGIVANWDCKNPEVKCGCHKWPAPIYNRTNPSHSSGCPFCAGVQICIHDNLAVRFPELAKEWGVNDKGPECYSHGSNFIANWECKNGHKWPASISNRTSKTRRGCPHCKKSKSKGEIMIESILTEMKISFKPQYSLMYNLEVDFHINYKGKDLFVERDGIQHFEYVEFFHKSMSRFQYGFFLDYIKTRCILIKGARLIRISDEYTKDETKDLLTKAFESEDQLICLSKTDSYSPLISKLKQTPETYYFDYLISNNIYNPFLEYQYHIQNRSEMKLILSEFFSKNYIESCHLSKAQTDKLVNVHYPQTDPVSRIENLTLFKTTQTFLVSLDKKTVVYGTLSEHKIVQNPSEFLETISKEENGKEKIKDLHYLLKRLKMDISITDKLVKSTPS